MMPYVSVNLKIKYSPKIEYGLTSYGKVTKQILISLQKVEQAYNYQNINEK